MSLLAKSSLRLLQRKFSQPLLRLPMKQLREESARWRWWQLVHSGQTLADGWQTSVMELAGSSSTSSCTSTSTSLHPSLPAPQPAAALLQQEAGPAPFSLASLRIARLQLLVYSLQQGLHQHQPLQPHKDRRRTFSGGTNFDKHGSLSFQLQCGFDENEQERVR